MVYWLIKTVDIKLGNVLEDSTEAYRLYPTETQDPERIISCMPAERAGAYLVVRCSHAVVC